MSLSRSESRQKEKAQRDNRRRRAFSLSLIAAGSIILLTGVGITVNQTGLTDWFGGGAKSGSGQTADGSNRNDADAGGAGSIAVTETPDAGEATPAPEPTDNGDASPPSSMPEEEPVDGEAEERVSLSFVGDMLPGEYIADIMAQNGYDFPYQKALLYLSEPDLMVGNLELPITTRGTPVEGTPYVYKGSPETLPAMRDAGFDVMSLANNHALDQGLEGMRDTMKHLTDAGIGFMGVGENDKEAFAPLIRETKGVKVAFIGVSEVIPFAGMKADSNVPGIAETYETTRAVASIKSATDEADIVVVMVHWGEDGKDTPENYQKNMARAYIDAGADLVIGSHPHVLQGFERYKGKWIAYSLGNFVYASNPSGAHGETGVLDAVCGPEGDCELKFNPMQVIQSQPTPLEGDLAVALLSRLSSISIGAEVRSDGSIVQQ
ncbi:CapA family protein [Paenibacillus soyae]|uniref:CapA family protein n=1 Tax=Paenibacillus soyae TaxID=2969249 RepID=A0A9X2MV84_9BACL|nr:CapA family protein [Paenibacillus soyae]MCR2806523.1 CapA family protein [Paenibacillus soyae]